MDWNSIVATVIRSIAFIALLLAWVPAYATRNDIPDGRRSTRGLLAVSATVGASFLGFATGAAIDGDLIALLFLVPAALLSALTMYLWRMQGQPRNAGAEA